MGCEPVVFEDPEQAFEAAVAGWASMAPLGGASGGAVGDVDARNLPGGDSTRALGYPPHSIESQPSRVVVRRSPW